jgi:hypothetical protein
MSDAFHIQTGLKQGKGKEVTPVLFFKTEYHAMKAYWGVEV